MELFSKPNIVFADLTAKTEKSPKIMFSLFIYSVSSVHLRI